MRASALALKNRPCEPGWLNGLDPNAGTVVSNVRAADRGASKSVGSNGRVGSGPTSPSHGIKAFSVVVAGVGEVVVATAAAERARESSVSGMCTGAPDCGRCDSCCFSSRRSSFAAADMLCWAARLFLRSICVRTCTRNNVHSWAVPVECARAHSGDQSGNCPSSTTGTRLLAAPLLAAYAQKGTRHRPSTHCCGKTCTAPDPAPLSFS